MWSSPTSDRARALTQARWRRSSSIRTGIRVIQALLGHSAIQTTSRYAHVSTRHVRGLRSPLDFLAEKDDARD